MLVRLALTFCRSRPTSIYGPKGIGALYVRRRRPRLMLAPLIDGGGHEHGLRSGTVNVPGAVGFGAAVEVCGQDMTAEASRVASLRDRLLAGSTSSDIWCEGQQWVDVVPASAQSQYEL